MSSHNPHKGHDAHDLDHGQVESSAVSPKPVLLFMAVLFVSTAFVFFVVKGLDWTFHKLELESAGQGQPATQIQTGRQLPPEPLLQGAPGKDNKPTELPLAAMATLRAETTKKLESYGWVDKSAGVTHIPIERAKDMIAEKGLTELTSPTIAEEIQNAEATRKEVLGAGSNAGRLIKVTGQSRQSVQPATQPAAQQPQQNPQQVPPQQH
jgi:hypothetical protein